MGSATLERVDGTPPAMQEIADRLRTVLDAMGDPVTAVHRWEATAAAGRAAEQLSLQRADIEPLLDLSGAMLTSLLLAASEDPQRRAMALTAGQLSRRAGGAGGSVSPAPHGGRFGRGRRMASLAQLVRDIRTPLADVARSYCLLDPRGRALSDSEHRDVRLMLQESAVCLRIVDAERGRVDAHAYAEHLHAVIVVAHAIQRSLVLAQSSDPDLRAQALTAEQLSELAHAHGLGPAVHVPAVHVLEPRSPRPASVPA
jgi:hypothetical protein